MRARTLAPALAVAALAAASTLISERQAVADEGWWLNSYAEAKRQAEESGKPILLVFR